MEAKFHQNQRLHFLKTGAPPRISNSSTSHCFCWNSCRNEKISLTKRLQSLKEVKLQSTTKDTRWNFVQVRGLSKEEDATKRFLVHVVKEGETLTSISRCYGLSIQAIVAVNADIVNINFVLEGQSLNIPVSAQENQMDSTWKFLLDRGNQHERCQSSWSFLTIHENNKVFKLLSSHHLQNAKSTGSFLVLVPLIAFCIRCIVGTIYHRVSKQLKQAADESQPYHQGERSMRWRSVLNDLGESDVADGESRQDSVSPPEDLPVPFEELSHAYTKLEPDYQKFLSECGMTNWGYWRRGSMD